MRRDIVPGATFPDYELPDETSTPRKLSEIQGDDPMILTLARGHFCPKEHQQHLELAALQAALQRGLARGFAHFARHGIVARQATSAIWVSR